MFKNYGISVTPSLTSSSTCIDFALAMSHKLPFRTSHVKAKQYFSLAMRNISC